MPKNMNNINIVKKVSSYHVDGHQIAINESNGDISVVFFQVFPFPVDEAGNLEAEVVSNVRLTLKQAEMLQKTLSDSIEGYRKLKKK